MLRCIGFSHQRTSILGMIVNHGSKTNPLLKKTCTAILLKAPFYIQVIDFNRANLTYKATGTSLGWIHMAFNRSLVLYKDSLEHMTLNRSLVLYKDSLKHMTLNRSFVLCKDSIEHMTLNRSLVLYNDSLKHMNFNMSLVLYKGSLKQLTLNMSLVLYLLINRAKKDAASKD